MKLLIIILALATSLQFYNGQNKGVVTAFGGIEIWGTPGVFLCEAHYVPQLDASIKNPLAPLFPSLVIDC